MVQTRGNPSQASLQTFTDAGYSEQQALQVVLAIAGRNKYGAPPWSQPSLARGGPSRKWMSWMEGMRLFGIRRSSLPWGFFGELLTALYMGVIAWIAAATHVHYILFPELGALAHDIIKRPHGTWAKAPGMLRDRADPAGDRSRDAHHPHIEVIDCPGHFGGRAANLTQHHKLVLPGIVAGRPDIARRDLPCLASLRPATAGANRLRCGR
ncbi:hypothetical protein G6F68_012886 [Rhizopus microsporus]|nr:hypothetical protein G6F68_012886 [Rhizopus microsporus]